MPQETKKKPVYDASEQTPSLQGLVASREDEKALLGALEEAFDYRGDITLTLTDGAVVKGYIFDRRTGDSLHDSQLRLLPEASDEKVTVRYDMIDRIEFTGRDTAAGKSFDTWIRKYVAKKLAGEEASIQSELLDGQPGESGGIG